MAIRRCSTLPTSPCQPGRLEQCMCNTQHTMLCVRRTTQQPASRRRVPPPQAARLFTSSKARTQPSSPTLADTRCARRTRCGEHRCGDARRGCVQAVAKPRAAVVCETNNNPKKRLPRQHMNNQSWQQYPTCSTLQPPDRHSHAVTQITAGIWVFCPRPTCASTACP